jgi:hypothetical protein
MATEQLVVEQADANDTIREYAAAAPFRSAEVYELVNEENPFRRPVRPDDLDWLDFTRILGPDETGSLSALLGNRILLNIYEADLLFWPQPAPHPSSENAADFYSDEARRLGELSRPTLERHLFTHLEQDAAEPVDGAQLADEIVSLAETEAAAVDATVTAIRGCDDPARAATFALLQLSARLPSAGVALGRLALGDDGGTQPELTRMALARLARDHERAAQMRALFEELALVAAPRAYWQFYLPSTLATVTYRHRVGRDHRRVFEAVGALLFDHVAESVAAERLTALVRETLGAETSCFEAAPEGSLRDDVATVVTQLWKRYGDDFSAGCRAGLRAAEKLQRAADHDLRTQVTWADDLETYKAKARRLHEWIESSGIEIDLDTFVESCEETSTTHVHDDHRLVVIEAGQMHFWNNTGARIGLDTGDMVLIPKGRLHGSTVLSGECTYHQPIIPDDMLRAIA